MKYKTASLFFLAGLFWATGSFAQNNSNTYKPWTYWWWMGSAVNQQDIKKQLADFSEAGLGGVHIIPIYGAKGFENQFIPFLSEKWLKMVQYTVKQAGDLNLGVDMTLGTGWPFGGPWVDSLNAAKRMQIREDPLKQYHIKAINTGQKVKRAAPGGEGPVMDYFDAKAVMYYLNHFDSVFSGTGFPVKPRAFYHDSYETYQANWSLRFIESFRDDEGYNLTDVLPVLMDTLNPQRPLIIHDFRETLSNLLYSEFAATWTEWCRNNGTRSRYQAHGSPGNLLDLYALADIPETESFGCSNFSIPKLACDPDYEEERFGRPSPLMMKFASSPAHLLNKPLVSSETGTWLANHFKVSLSRIKPQVDELFVSGINHVFYHGITYSPANEAYPGWLFYASTNYGQTSHFWDELPLLNSYIQECQRRLQNSTHDNDILLYFPIDDLWTKYPGDLLLLLDVHKYSSWFGKTEFGKISGLLWDQGFAFDYISDKQLKQLTVTPDRKLSADGRSTYSVIVIPSVGYINKNTLKQLDSLAQKGAKIIFEGKLPDNLSGLMAQKLPDSEWVGLKRKFSANAMISSDLIRDLKMLNIRQEEIKLKGLDFIRKITGGESEYFITNLGGKFYEGSVSLAVKSNFIEIFDPQSSKTGYVETSDKFFFQLAPGKSCFVKPLKEKPESPPWQYSINRDTINIDNEWKVRFISGNVRDLKPVYRIDTLKSWTEWGDPALKSFCGKAEYVSAFTIGNYDKSANYKLVFDDIRESATVSINGVLCGTIWSLPYCLEIPAAVLRKENTIEITVQNLSANLIRSMDIQKFPWKKFYNINIVDIKYNPFDASGWDYVASGLVGNVFLIKVDAAQ